MRSYWIKVDPTSKDLCLCKRKIRTFQTQRHTREEGHKKTKIKVGVMQKQDRETKGCQ